MTLELHGQQIIGGQTFAASGQTFTATNPATGEALPTAFHEGTADEADRALQAADRVFDAFRHSSADQRADLLDAIADEIEALGDQLLERCNAETGLPMGRQQAERGRTVNQARLFATMIRDGSWVDARIDRANPDREPMPKPDIRRMLIGIGPVAVFGASNFPLAISVAGTDTICALGAGCPVVVKAHPGHPGTCELLARAIGKAIEKVGLPADVFSLVHGVGHEIGMALVKHPLTKAVGFTGSLKAGRALFDAAAARPEPIPVYAEMGSANPVFMLPGALAERGEQLAQGLIGSVTLGVGQFCTSPGLVFGLSDETFSKFAFDAAKAAEAAAPATMLHGGIHQSYCDGVKRLSSVDGVKQLGASSDEPGQTQAACVILATDASTFEANAGLNEEVFGPASLLVEAQDASELERIASNLDGHLTATIQGTPDDLREHRQLVSILERKVGRLIFNGFPTGVEVCHAMHHGGPYPATTDSHFTSIGTASIARFARPICYQDFPDDVLPEALRNANGRGSWRLIDGELTKEDA